MSITSMISLNGLNTADCYVERIELSPLSLPGPREAVTISQLSKSTKETEKPIVILSWLTGFDPSDTYWESGIHAAWLERKRKLMTLFASTKYQPFAVELSQVEDGARLQTLRTRIYACSQGCICVPNLSNTLTLEGMAVAGSTSQPVVRRFLDGVRASSGTSSSWATAPITSPDSPVFRANWPTGTNPQQPCGKPKPESQKAEPRSSYSPPSELSQIVSRSKWDRSLRTKYSKELQLTVRLCAECERRIMSGTVPDWLRYNIGKATLLSVRQVICSSNRPACYGCAEFPESV